MDKQLGMEATPDAYVSRLVEVFRLVRAALAPWGTCWLNIGDTYSGGSGGNATASPKQRSNHGTMIEPQSRRVAVDAGNLCLIPQRLALALQADGWVVRSVICWVKPSPMPQSVAGWRWQRCRVKAKEGGRGGKGHARMFANETPGNVAGQSVAQWTDCPGCPRCEPNGGYVLRRGSWRPTSSWEPILMLAKSPTYFCDGEAVKTPAAPATVQRDLYTRVLDDPGEQFAVRHDHETLCLSGANARDVQTWAAECLREHYCPVCQWLGTFGATARRRPDPLRRRCPQCKARAISHYAAFPTALVHFCLAAACSSRGYCPGCGAPWARVVRTKFVPQPDVSREKGVRGSGRQKPMDESNRSDGTPRGTTQATTLGWRPTCACPPQEPRPGRVLDPFAGSGRVGLACQKLGLDFLGCELNPEYAAMARRLLAADAPLFDEVT